MSCTITNPSNILILFCLLSSLQFFIILLLQFPYLESTITMISTWPYFPPFITITNIRHIDYLTVCQDIGTVSSRVLGSLTKYVQLICIFNGTDSIKQILTENLSVAQTVKQISVPYKTRFITLLTPAHQSSQS